MFVTAGGSEAAGGGTRWCPGRGGKGQAGAGGRLGEAVELYLHKGVAESTRRTYTVAWSRYLRYCGAEGVPPLPVLERGLYRFVAALAVEGVASSTIRTYLAGVRHAQVERGRPDPQWGSIPRLGLVLKGIRRCRAEEGCKDRVRLPVSPEMLLVLRGSWRRRAGWDSVMLWAAVCLCFFGCTRAGEITAPERGNVDPGAHLTFQDIVVDNADKPRKISVSIKASKTDPFRVGVDIHVGWTGKKLCPVAAIMAYLVARKDGPGPLFRFEDGRPLTRPRLVLEVRRALDEAGASSAGISGHSFRIRAATTAAEQGVEDSTIKDLGWWRSNAYQRYIQRDRANLAGLAEKLAREEPNAGQGVLPLVLLDHSQSRVFVHSVFVVFSSLLMGIVELV